MDKTISKSFRLPSTDATWLQITAKNIGVSQTELVSKCISSAKLSDGKSIASKSMESGGITEDNEALKILTQFGIATASGIAGYHIAGFIRKELEMDEDKGTQLLIGMLCGIAPLLIMAFRAEK
jgi:hypothetical protein